MSNPCNCPTIADAIAAMYNSLVGMVGESVTVTRRNLGADDNLSYYDPVPNPSTAQYMARVGKPTEKDVQIEAGYFLDSYRIFYLPATASLAQRDTITIDRTAETFIVTEFHTYPFDGGDVYLQVTGRRQKT